MTSCLNDNTSCRQQSLFEKCKLISSPPCVCLERTSQTCLCVISSIHVPESLQWEQAEAGQRSARTELELGGARGHRRPLGEAWEPETELDQQGACDWGPRGEGRSGKPESGKEPCLTPCRCCGVKHKRQVYFTNKHFKYNSRDCFLQVI